MRVLAIHGSPHNGHTLKLVQRFESVIKKLGPVDFEYLSVKDLDIKSCRGCFSCITRGEDLCPQKNDSLPDFLGKLDGADGVVFAAPTYMYNVPALMKNLMDRLSYLGHRPRYVGKPAVVMSTTCGIGLKEGLNNLAFGTAGAWGFNVAGRIGARTHPFSFDRQSRKKLEAALERTARRFHKALSRKGPPAADFGNLMRFRVISQSALHSREFFPADYAYYIESGKKYYFTPSRIGFLDDIWSRILASIIGRSMKKSRRKVDMNMKFLDW